MSRLSSCQMGGLHAVTNWYLDCRKTKKLNFILDGAGGVGKTYLVKRILQSIPKAKPLIITYTNEALEQIRSKTGENYSYMTVYKSLGLRPTQTERDLRFEAHSLPQHWQHYNLCVVDEASMLSQWEINMLLSVGIPILWVGHEKQLPPIDNKRLSTDKCISPIFHMGFEIFTLKTPMRNGGKLWDFITICEHIVDYPLTEIPSTFDITTLNLRNYLKDSSIDLAEGRTKFVSWTRMSVKHFNNLARSLIYGDQAALSPYLPGDKVIFIYPTYYMENPVILNEKNFFNLVKKEAILATYTNTKGTVESCRQVKVNWNSEWQITCYAITLVVDSGERITCYEPINHDQILALINSYEYAAWSATTPKAKEECYKKRNSLMALFGSVEVKGKDRIFHKNLLHFYAATSYRLQGSTVQNVITIDSNISSCSNPYEAAKHRYVAVSRTAEKLMFYRGVSI